MDAPDDARAGRSPLERFEASMVLDYEKWHDGIGYDIDALLATDGPDREAAQHLVVARLQARDLDWRDVEALAALDTPSARQALHEALMWASSDQQLAIARYAPDVIDHDARVEAIVDGLRQAEFYGGLTQALDAAAELHPPAVITALLEGALHRQGDGPVHFAALLLWLFGQADSTFDDTQRPFLLRFNTADAAERRAVFVELCHRIGVAPDPYL